MSNKLKHVQNANEIKQSKAAEEEEAATTMAWKMWK